MADRLNKEILDKLINRTGLKEKTVRNKIATIRQRNSVLTMNAAAQVLADQYKISFRPKLDQDDKRTLSTYQQYTRMGDFTQNITHKSDNRTYTIAESSIHNLAIGDNSRFNQNVNILGSELELLLEYLNNSDKLSPAQKDDYSLDIQTIATQAKKSEPNIQIIKSAWESIKVLSTIDGFTGLITRLTPLIINLTQNIPHF